MEVHDVADKFLASVKRTINTVPIHPPDPSGAVVPEIGQLAANITEKFSPEVLRVACTWTVTRSILEHYAASRKTDLTSITDVLREALRLWLRVQNIPEDQVVAALEALQQSGEVAGYLSQVPE